MEPPPPIYRPAPIPAFEPERLQDLYQLKILDTAAEERFDRYTSLTADLFEVPIVLVSLVDKDRQWFKSACGLSFRETTRDLAFCAHALCEPEMLVVPNAE
ncbi:MAG: GGDEF domain-containing protein, partial [Gammaproteobacteria bacterium]|nr:GGDEF domain-containing protein [Gammaproteobacteria bacterium]